MDFKQEVLNIANQLCNTNGSTTTLDVKVELRREGVPEHKAHQKNISEIMNELANEDNFEHSFNGQYRIYTKSITQLAVQTKKASPQIKTFTTTVKLLQSIDAVNGDWEIYNVINSDKLYISDSYNRDVARRKGNAEWSNIHYNNIRAKRYNI